MLQQLHLLPARCCHQARHTTCCFHSNGYMQSANSLATAHRAGGVLLRGLELCRWQRILPVKDVVQQHPAAAGLGAAPASGLEANLRQQQRGCTNTACMCICGSISDSPR